LGLCWIKSRYQDTTKGKIKVDKYTLRVYSEDTLKQIGEIQMTQVNPKYQPGTPGDFRSSFVGNQRPEKEVWLRNFVNNQVPEEEVWLRNFVNSQVQEK